MAATSTELKRILMVLQTTAVGGMETHAVDLAAEYVRRGLTVGAIVPETNEFDGLEERFKTAGAVVQRLDTDARSGRIEQVVRWWRLLRVLRGSRPDAVHLHTGGATGGLAILAMARAVTRATVVLTEHDVPTEKPNGHQRLARFGIDRLVHTLIAVSRRNALLRAARLGAPRDRFAVVLNGVPIPVMQREAVASARASLRAELGIGQETVVLGSVVRLADGKGLHDLINAFAIVRQSADAHLVLVGEGPLRDELSSLARQLGVADVVHFAGYHSDPTPYVDAMDVFVLAVPAGSMSIALLEAMARGVPPVICFGGPEEAVVSGSTGLNAPPNNPQGLASVLLQLVDDPELRQHMSAAATEHVQRHFSVQRVAADLLEIYSTAASGQLPLLLRADAPPDPRPGNRSLPLAHPA